MASSSLFRSIFFPEKPLLSFPLNLISFPSSSVRFDSSLRPSTLNLRVLQRNFRVLQRSSLKCSHGENISPSSSYQDDQSPPQEVVLKAISEVSKTEGRIAQTTNVVLGGTVTDDSTNEWLVLDQKVNSYPMARGFTAIGTGGDDFVQAMVVAVESVLEQPIPEGRVTQRLSSRGKYVSVNIGPVRVASSEQVQAVYNAMKRDDRMKYFF
ncbi:phosphoribosylformylglycinamidine synthase [Tasmannia lanceolata]|uniref:phosphoribosylformylglycinamidine synthase n=1 Tax=Tasmannia lanceolata TaxID=3420 RepID=UPI004062AAB3